MGRKLIAAVLVGILYLWLRAWLAPAPPPWVDPVHLPRPAVLPTIRTGDHQLAGIVRNAKGEPQAGADITILFAARPILPEGCAGMLDGCSCGKDLEQALALLDKAFEPLARATTATDGSFVIRGLPAALLEARASYDDKHYAVARAYVHGTRAHVDMTLDRSTSGDTFVVGADGLELPPGAGLLAIVDRRIVDFGRSKLTWSFWLMAPQARVLAYAPGLVWTRTRQRVSTLNRDGTPDLGTALWMVPGAALSGKLERDGGEPGGVLMRAEAASGACATAVTAPDGTWDMGPVLPGSYEVTARAGKWTTTFTAAADP